MKAEVATQPGVWTRMGSAITSTGAKIASAFVAMGVAKWLKDSVGAAQEAENAQVRLMKSVEATGGSWQTQGGAIDALIQKHSSLAAVDDEALSGAFSTLAQTSGSTATAMQHLALVTDVARGANIDLNTAAKLVGKVSEGNTSSLSRYGITVKEGATATEALGLLQKRFSGQAEAYGKTAAGASDRFKTALGNLQETVGTVLLPVVTTLAGWLVKLLEKFQGLPGPVQKVAVALGAGLAAAMVLAPWMKSLGAAVGIATSAYKALFIAKTQDGVVTKAGLVQYGILRAKMLAQAAASKLVAAGQWLVNAAMSANPIFLIVTAIVALVAIFVLLWTKCDWFRNFWIAVWEHVKAVAQSVWPVIKAVGEKIVAALQWAWDTLSAAINWFWGWAGGFITAGITQWWTVIKATATTIIAVAQWLWDTISAAVSWFWGWAGPYITTAVTQWWTVIKTTFTLIIAVVSAAWDAIKAAVSWFWGWAGPFITQSVQAWWTIIKTTFEAIKTVISTAWDVIKTVVSGAIENVKAAIHTIQSVVGFVRDVFTNVKDAAVDKLKALIDWVGDLGSKVKNSIGNLGNLLYSVGQDIVRGLLNGITEAWSWITDKLSSLIAGLSDAAKKVLGISSPSRVFDAIGRQVGAGFAQGIDASHRVIAAAVDGMATTTTGGFELQPAYAGGGGRSVVIMPGAVQVSVGGTTSMTPDQLTAATRAGIDPALEQLARAIAAL